MTGTPGRGTDAVICKYQSVSGECITIDLHDFGIDAWTHSCATIEPDAPARNETHAHTTIRGYVNGELRDTGMLHRVSVCLLGYA